MLEDIEILLGGLGTFILAILKAVETLKPSKKKKEEETQIKLPQEAPLNQRASFPYTLAV
ncbi:MAG: hypothetical protein GX483_02725 [Actinomycetaceae bacterium]|nr:hypothetical protein [Actinomycetaceae bacterium]